MKEQFEWIHSWCDETMQNDLPLLSTCQYFIRLICENY